MAQSFRCAGALIFSVGFIFIPALHAEISKEQQAFFRERIEPVLSDNCYKCHSPAQKVKGGLALDSREGILKGGDDGKIIVAGHPSDSMLLERLASKDPDEKMPPKDGPLSAQQLADITEWVKMGAPDPRSAPAGYDTASAKAHWSWQPLRNQPVPAVKDAVWCKTPVDNFIEAKLETAGLAPSAPADRSTLIRRAYYDLIGLPPMPWEVQAFIDDKTPKAWEKVIDHLLASPHYGERWGRYWLDVARYSDTKGDPGKKQNPLYVDAWTYRDYVIDSFNKDKPYDRFILEQLAADKLNLGPDKSALAALGFITVGDRFNGNRNDVINDEIDVVSKGFLGLTVTCARCHDHKFDPIPQKDYYSLHGIFASTVEPKDDPVIAGEGTPAEYQAYVHDRDVALNEAKKFASNSLDEIRHDFREHAAAFLLASRADGPDRVKLIKDIGGPPKIMQQLAQALGRRLNFARRDPVLGPWARYAEIPAADFAEKAPELTAEIVAANDPRFQVNSLVLSMFRNKSAPKDLQEVASRYQELFIQVDKTVEPPKPALLAMASAAAVPGALAPISAGQRDLEEVRLTPLRLDPEKEFDEKEIAQKLPPRLAIQFQQKLSAVSKVELTHPGAPKRAMVVEDAAKPQNSPVFIRGEATSKGDIVPRRFLEILSGPNRPEFKEGSGRLELAQAIASPANPLTARVMINRIWEHHFGDGFVITPDDLGTQSGPPSHPELLDYLATRFVQSGWSIKAIHKLIMLSAAYQQSSETNPAGASADPGNRLLWRYNIRRLEFEPVRDSLLYISGRLDLTVGGHPVNILSEPYSLRRSVYGFVDRGNLPEMMNQFDFANPGMPLGKRHETTVPQQALFMMNSPLMIEVVRALLKRPEMARAKTDAQRVHALYWMVYQRQPKPAEIELGIGFLKAVEAEKSHEAPLPPPSAKPADLPPGKMTKEQLIAMRKEKFQEMRKGGGFQLQNEGEKVARTPLTPWEKYTHALLMANEAVYYN